MIKYSYCVILVLMIAYSQQILQVKLQNYSAKGFNEDTGKLSWLVEGKKAVILGEKYDLQDATITFFKKYDKQVVKTKSCLYDTSKKVTYSKEKVFVKGKSFALKGKGFDIDYDKKSIYIRSQVEGIWKTQ